MVRRVDHRLLIVCYKAGARPIKIQDKEYDSGYEHSHNVDRQPVAFRFEPARVTCKCAGKAAMAKSDSSTIFGTRPRSAARRFPWLSIISFSVWIKSPVGTIPLSFAAIAFVCCQSAFLKRVRAINNSHLFGQRCAAPDDVEANLHVFLQQFQRFSSVWFG